MGAVSGGIVTMSTISRAESPSTVDIPELISGDEVVQYRKVPKDWYQHQQHAKKLLERKREKLHNIPGVQETQLEASSQTYGGVRGRKIVTLVSEDAPGRKEIPSKLEEIPVEVRNMPKKEAGCPDDSSDDNCIDDDGTDSVPGGYTFGNPNVDGGGYGSSCCQVQKSDVGYMLTVAHAFGDHCNDDDLVGHDAYAAGEKVGEVVEWNRDEDWALIDTTFGGDWQNHIRDTRTNPNVAGHVGESSLDYWESENTNCTTQAGRTTADTHGKVQATHVSSTTVCTDYNGHGVKTYCNFAGGDSGGPTYHVDSTGEAYMVSVTGYGYNWIGSVCFNNQYGNSGGTAAYRLNNQHNMSFKLV
jgi:hypothetical protein